MQMLFYIFVLFLFYCGYVMIDVLIKVSFFIVGIVLVLSILMERAFKREKENIISWRPIEEAPKDKIVILDVGNPIAVLGIWNEQNKSWCYTNLQSELCEEDFINKYFEAEYKEKFFINLKDKKNVKWWMPLPDQIRN